MTDFKPFISLAPIMEFIKKNTAMLRNYFTTALRNFKKNKFHTFLNIFGLGLGLACCLVVYTIIDYEYSFDDFHKQKDQIYRVVKTYYGDNYTSHLSTMPYPLGEAIKNEIPEIEEVLNFHGPIEHKFSFIDAKGDFQIYLQNVLFASENFFDVLDFEIISGRDGSALKDPNTVFLTEKVAKKYFGDANPVGKTLKIFNEKDVVVAGVIKDITTKTNFPFDILASYKIFRDKWPGVFDQWNMTWNGNVYVKPDPNSSPVQLAEKVKGVFKNHVSDDEYQRSTFELQPLKMVHTDERFAHDTGNYVTPSLMINAFIFLGCLLLITAILNFVNLSTAQAIKRAKEVGVRKTLGSSKKQLIFQFIFETFIVVMASTVLAYTLGQVLMNQFEGIIRYTNYDLSFTTEVLFFSIFMVVVITLLSGFYPSVIIAGYRPLTALNNQVNLRKGSGSYNLRRGLVITQFVFTNLILISTIIISAQMTYVRTKPLGFDMDNVVVVTFPEGSQEKIQTVKKVYEQNPYVQNAAWQFGAPMALSNWSSSYGPKEQEKKDGHNANTKFVDEEYLEFYNIKLIAGRMFKNRTIDDSTFNIVVNQALLRQTGWTHDEALGQWINFGYADGKIIGVSEDFHASSLHSSLKPVIFMHRPSHMNSLALKIPEEDIGTRISAIEATFRSFFPNELFEYSILKDNLNIFYFMEDLLYKVIRVISFLAIMMSMIGLYGLVSFMANQSSKSIGIRKVYGATIGNILQRFTIEYLILMLVAFLLAAPISYYMVNEWMETFTYRIDIGLVYFIQGLIISLLITIITASYRSYKAATANPVEALRNE
ncbi:MAG TPA: ABC transporter permease [Cyclobacteriaceae bacterium]